MTESRKQTKAKDTGNSPVASARNIPQLTQILLFVHAGGRCEFNGCNKFLLEHPLTLTRANFAEKAHIVAFKKGGPRGREGARPSNINSLENLMLLCPECHHLIDSHPAQHPRSTLEGFKRQHEDRIVHLTGLAPNRKTAVLAFTAPIRGQDVSIPTEQITDALFPRYPLSRAGTLIDLGQLAGTSEHDGVLKVGCAQIDRHLERLFAPGGEASDAGHVSVFALGPIPLLIYLGSRLTNKVATDIFQRHRAPENWTWKDDGAVVQYKVGCRRAAERGKPVALLLALSGSISTESLPTAIPADAALYEITLEGRAPDPTFLRRREDLELFKIAFQEALGLILANHGTIEAIDLIPAIPAPIAVLCGRERLPKVHPSLRVYDFDHARGGYNFIFEVK